VARGLVAQQNRDFQKNNIGVFAIEMEENPKKIKFMFICQI